MICVKLYHLRKMPLTFQTFVLLYTFVYFIMTLGLQTKCFSMIISYFLSGFSITI